MQASVGLASPIGPGSVGSGTVASGQPIDTSTSGTHTVEGTASYTVFGITTTSLPGGTVYSARNKVHYMANPTAIGGNVP